MNIVKIVEDTCKETFMHISDLDFERPLLDIGIDSVDLMMLMVALEDKLNITLEDEIYTSKIENLNDICNLIKDDN